MIDNDDADAFWILSLWVKNPILSIIFGILCIVFTYQACVNKSDCAKQYCPNGGHAILLKNECLCVTPATPTPTFSLTPNNQN